MSEEEVILTPEQQAHADFLASIERFRNPVNGAYYTWVEVPVEMLNLPIPEGVAWGTIVLESDEEGNPVKTRQKAVGEFILDAVLSVDQTTAIGSLAAMERPTLRALKVDWQEMLNWKMMMEPYGLTVDMWMDERRRDARMESGDYRNNDNS